MVNNDDKIDKTLSKYSGTSTNTNNKNKKEEDLLKDETSYNNLNGNSRDFKNTRGLPF